MEPAVPKQISMQERSKQIQLLLPKALAMYNDHSLPVHAIVAQLGISETGFYRLLRRSGIQPNAPRSGGGERCFTEEQDRMVAHEYRQGMSMEQLAEKYGCWRGAIKHALTRQGVTLRRRGGVTQPLPEGLGELLCADWHAGLSQRAIAEKHGLSEDKVYKILRRFPALGPKLIRRGYHPHWKGGRRLHEGYVMVLLETDHPFHEMTNEAGYVLEHRLVMAEALGRALTPRETVHHLNSDRSDNRVENLQLRQGKHGSGVIYHCADCGSLNVVAQSIADAPEA
jgi:uncharacterized protein (DUF433 family)